MIFDPPLQAVRFVRRYQRFFAECVDADGQVLLAHCANTGRMTGLLTPGAEAWIRQQPPGRKLTHAWELVNTETGLACVNTARANSLLAESHPLEGWGSVVSVRREPRVGTHRFDLAYRLNSGKEALLEVKTVTWAVEGVGYFPDAPSARATAHLRLLTALAREGSPVGVVFVAMHTGIREIRPAVSIDPVFAGACAEAASAGVRFEGRAVEITPQALRLGGPLPVHVQSPGSQYPV